MKTLLKTTIFAMVLVGSIANLQAKIWRVNNNDTTAHFKTLQGAHDTIKLTGNIGDTIHLEPSNTSYGDIKLIFPLVIIGPGYFLGNNIGTQNNPKTSKIETVIFHSGSEGSIIEGCEIIGGSASSSYFGISLGVSSIIVRKNYFSGGTSTYDNGILYFGASSYSGTGAITNVIISQNYFITRIGFNNIYPADQIIISNNIFQQGTPVSNFTTTATGRFENNIFQSSASFGSPFWNIINNIQTGGTFSCVGCVIKNNIGISGQFGSADSNITAPLTGIGGLINDSPYTSNDSKWILKAGSPAIDHGLYQDADGSAADCGVFGGPTPYVLSGLPNIPAIYQLDVPTYTNPVQGLQVTIKAKSH